MKRIFLVLYLGFFAMIFSCNTPEDFTYIKRTGRVFGTSYIINYKASKNYQREFDELFEAINNSVSTYIPNSDISKINAEDISIEIDDYFKEVMQKSKRIFKETDGYFDPTVGNLVNAWGFGPKDEINNLDSIQVENMMKLVGFDKVSVEGNIIMKQDPKIYLDFNSIAKGYGIDVIARFLESKKIDNYLIEIGGEIRAKGFNSRQKPWKVQLENPLKNDTREGITYLGLTKHSMATSGNYRKFRVTEDGRKFVHTVNPKTGFATESNLLSASVIAEKDCADVDAYATALMAMGLEKSLEFIKDHPELSVILIYENENGELSNYSTNSIQKLLN